MARLSKSLLYERLRNDIAGAGGTSLFVSGSGSPRDMIVTLDGIAERIRVYIWNLTYDRTRDDYKFQVTSLRGGALEFDFDTRTVLLGYYEAAGVYLAADAYRRRRIGGRSNAIQTRQAQIDDAYRDGIHAFEKAGTGEIALVVRNDLIATYLIESESMHAIGATSEGLTRLNRLATAIGGPVDLPPGLKPRDKRESRVLRTIRDGNFRKRVLAAYGFQCCVCTMQLDLPEAAHIVEARASMSSDDVRNGLALVPAAPRRLRRRADRHHADIRRPGEPAANPGSDRGVTRRWSPRIPKRPTTQNPLAVQPLRPPGPGISETGPGLARVALAFGTRNTPAPSQ